MSRRVGMKNQTKPDEGEKKIPEGFDPPADDGKSGEAEKKDKK